MRPSHLKEDILTFEQVGVDGVHVDVMDGDFVLGVCSVNMVRRVRSCTEFPVSVHLMVRQPLNYLDDLLESQPEIIYVHFEAENPTACLKYLRAHKCRAGLAICPETSAEELVDILPLVDQLLLLRVPAGKIGQPNIPHVEEKIHRLLHYPNRHFGITCDGAISAEVIAKWRPHGVTHFVCGMTSGLFAKGAEVSAIYQRLKEAGGF